MTAPGIEGEGIGAEETRGVVEAAIDYGVTLVDTADV
jgi:aryl-alcohol dehydrogenase-like predicted oxidoreductase